MTSIPDFSHLLVGAMGFIRVSAILFALPVIGDAPTPLSVRVALAMALTIMIYPQIRVYPSSGTLPTEVWAMGATVLGELLIGLTLGFASRLGFDGIIGASQVVASQMGFGSDRLFLPDLKSEVDGFTALHRMLVMLMFLSLGLHAVFFGALADSFRLIPLGHAGFSPPLFQTIVSLSAAVLSTAIQLAAPILIALLFTTAALGLLSRTVPQLNVFAISFPISFLVGLLLYVATLPLFPDWLTTTMSETKSKLSSLISNLEIP